MVIFQQVNQKKTNEKLNEDAEDSGKTHKSSESNKDNEPEEKDKTSDKTDEMILNNIEYILSKTPLLSYFTDCSKNTIDTIFEYMDSREDKRNIYIDSLLLSTNDSNETIYNSIKKLYNSLSYTKNKIDDFILLFNKKYDSILDKYLQNYDIIMYIDEVIKLIDSYIGVSESEKKLLGEVFTPFELIDEMLDTLPEEVWSNPNLKWLDPANGIGNFPIMVVKRLLDGLVDFEPDYDKRYKKIMENMIYVCDINPKNMFIFNNLFNPNEDIKLNSHRGSFLEEPFDIIMKDVWGVEKFDIVMGNPPYNLGQNAKGKRGGGDTLWDKFVIKSLNFSLKENGYLVFVHPTLWRKPQSLRSSSRKVNELMMKKQIHYLEMHDSSDGMKIFNAGTRYDFYLLENCLIYKDTLINGEDRKNIEINLKNYNFIPNYNIELFDKIISKQIDESCSIIYNRTNYGTDKIWVSDKKDDTYKYELVHTTPKS
ncbi:MAG: Eco57I restriction-modification methylase domain-containing protein, partial [bacterium]